MEEREERKGHKERKIRKDKRRKVREQRCNGSSGVTTEIAGERSKQEERGQVEIRTGRRGLIQKSRGQEDYGKYRR